MIEREKPFVTVCCPTWLRPVQLGYLIRCFERQTYPADRRELVILDDAGQYEDRIGDHWRIDSRLNRCPTLGEKRNACARMACNLTECFFHWDDDDLYLPWAISAGVAALETAEWSRPSRVLQLRSDGRLVQRRTANREDDSDKAFAGGWAIRAKTFWDVGGYPATSMDEDKELARVLVAAGASEVDPIALGFRPFFVWAPWDNDHLSGHPQETGYRDWGQRPVTPATVVPTEPPGIDLENPAIAEQVEPRCFAGDWS